jgi:hypothetical protein
MDAYGQICVKKIKILTINIRNPTSGDFLHKKISPVFADKS